MTEDLELTEDQTINRLLGQTITGVSVEPKGHPHDWEFNCGDVTLTLDSGDVIEFRSYGFDACGTTAYLKYGTNKGREASYD